MSEICCWNNHFWSKSQMIFLEFMQDLSGVGGEMRKIIKKIRYFNGLLIREL